MMVDLLFIFLFMKIRMIVDPRMWYNGICGKKQYLGAHRCWGPFRQGSMALLDANVHSRRVNLSGEKRGR